MSLHHHRDCNQYNVSSQLILNPDQTGLQIVPVSNWILKVEEWKQVYILDLEDKHESTGLISNNFWIYSIVSFTKQPLTELSTSENYYRK